MLNIKGDIMEGIVDNRYTHVQVAGMDPDFGGYKHNACGIIFPVDPTIEENLVLRNHELK